MSNNIVQLTSATNWIFVLREDDSLWMADCTMVPLNWTSIPYGGSGIPAIIEGACFPGPMGLSFLFIHASDDTLWSWQYESNEWLQRVYPP
jgi:hypothetical protein